MSLPSTYEKRRFELEEYFDRTAAATWAKLTAEGPVSRVREKVRRGRGRMRDTLLSYLPDDLSGQRLLDAGCGTGALSVAAARRGAAVVAIDLSATLVNIAKERVPSDVPASAIEFGVNDMLSAAASGFDWIVAMDSLIHYNATDMVEMIAKLYSHARRGVILTYAPRTPLLMMLWAVGKAFPRKDRSPAIEPIATSRLAQRLKSNTDLSQLVIGRSARIDEFFYVSQALELRRG